MYLCKKKKFFQEVNAKHSMFVCTVCVCVCSWVFEASNTGSTWVKLREHVNDTALKGRGSTHTWPVSSTTSFTKFRIRSTGKNSNNHDYIALSGFELYGKGTVPNISSSSGRKGFLY